MKTSFLAECYPLLEKDLLEEMENSSVLQSFAATDYVVRQGQYIQHLPIVLEGSIKVFSIEESVQFLLYYISSGESCIYSFAHTYTHEPISFSAVAEVDSQLLLLPLEKVSRWLRVYPSFSSLVLSDYQKQYQDLLKMTKQIICQKLDERLLNYLRERTEIEQTDLLSISHQEIADDLGSSREVISRLLKKLSLSNHVKQEGRKIKVL